MSRSIALRALFLRDLDRLAREVEAYPDDDAFWRTGGDIPNAAGTLALHLAGNLRHFVGAALGGTGYVRDREREFGARDVPRARILAEIAAARTAVADTLSALDDAALEAAWTGGGPLGSDATVEAMLVHLAGHLNYHLGQINYHRRLLAPEE